MNFVNIIIIFVYIYLLYCQINREDTGSIIILTLVVLFALWYNRRYRAFELFEVQGDYANIPETKIDPEYVPEVFPGLLADRVKNYDGLCLKTGNTESWSHDPNNLPLLSNDELYVVQGNAVPSVQYQTNEDHLIGPPINGFEGGPEKMFMLANNLSAPECCPSTFADSTGCVCTTDAQRDYIALRGGNGVGCAL